MYLSKALQLTNIVHNSVNSFLENLFNVFNNSIRSRDLFINKFKYAPHRNK